MMKMRSFFCFLACLSLAGGLFAQAQAPATAPSPTPTAAADEAAGSASQSEIDALFDEGQGGDQGDQGDQQGGTPDGGTALQSLNQALTKPGPSVSGSGSLTGWVMLGWPELAELSDIIENVDGSVGYNMSLSASLDVRPDPNFHLFGSFSASFPAGTSTVSSDSPLDDLYKVLGSRGQVTNVNWSGISIGEMYIDYTLLDTLFFRIGKTASSWGQGRILGNPGNLAAGSETGASVKLSFPLFGYGFNVVAMAQPGYFGGDGALNWFDLGVATNYEFSLAFMNFGLSGFWQKDRGPAAEAYAKTSVAGVDLYAEGVMVFPGFNVANPLPNPAFTATAGFFWEGLEPKLQLKGEYLFNGVNTTGMDHRVALGARVSGLFGIGVATGLLWSHAFVDGSGCLAWDTRIPIDGRLSMNLTVPFTYGAPGATLRKTAAALSLIVKTDLSTSF